MEQNELKEFLGSTLFGKGLSSSELDKVLKISQKKTFKASEFIAHKNSPGGEMYLIINGIVNIPVDGTTITSRIAGDLIGEQAGWYRITLDNGQAGWISGTYAQKNKSAYEINYPNNQQRPNHNG